LRRNNFGSLPLAWLGLFLSPSVKRQRGFAGREDIQTFFDFHKADEEAE